MKRILFALFFTLLSLSAFAQTSTDSIGIYAVTENGINRIDMLRYMQTKNTAGYFRGKSKLRFRGETSRTHFNGKAVFLIYFGTPRSAEDFNYFMFNPSYSIDDFGVLEFKTKKGDRYLTTVKVAPFRTKVGAEEDHTFLKVEKKKIRENVYQITVSGMTGEYCIAPMANGVAGYTGVFDFTIDTL